jgi:flagellar biogenesis protein FliO
MGAALALIVAAQPLGAQAKQGATTINESDLLIPGGTAAAGTAAGTAAPGAAGTPAAAPAAPSTPGVTTWDFVRMLLILAAVVGVIYLVFWMLRRGSGKKIQENNIIHVLGSRSLAGSRALHLVEVGKSVYLVGASDGGVELISEITDKESLDAVRLKAAEENPGGRRTFPQILAEIFRPAKKPLSLGDGIGLFKGQRERLRKL